MSDPPLTQGPAPLLNRAWSRRGWASAPYFGKSVPSIVMESTILIERRTPDVPNDLGGFKSGPWQTIYNGPAHIEHFEEVRPALVASDLTPALGVALYHHYEVYMPIPEDPAMVPQNGDKATFNDGYEVHIHPVMHVEMSAGLTDHLELWLDEYESL